MTIHWRQVLEIETYLNDIFEKNPTIERVLCWHWQSINSGLRVDKCKKYTFEDVQEYLTSKYPKDEMIKNGIEGIRQLFNACLTGQRICEIDQELLEINEFQEEYRLSDEVLKKNILNCCAAFTGSTSFYMQVLKHIVDNERKKGNVQELDDTTKEHLKRHFDTFEIEHSEFESNNNLLTAKITAFMNDSRFKGYCTSCEKNYYELPYTSDDIKLFLKDVLNFSKTEVHDIINESSTELFAYKIRNNESPYPTDLRRTDLGDINIYTTLYGLFNYDRIKELKSNNQLLSNIKTILEKQFEILPRESIIDDYNPDYTTSINQRNSSLIIGTNLDLKKLYNKYIDDYHVKVINGYIWFNDDVHGISYDYLNFHDETNYSGEYKYSMPFENVIFSYHIAYLEIARIERDYEDLRNKGYFKSKDENLQEIHGESSYEDDEYDYDDTD